MMKIVKKLKAQFKRFMTGKSGFSLVELIVVIAIMAVMAAVLAPALLGYVEKSRAQKDYSAMGEVSNSVQLSLADSSVYDELLVCSEKDNYSCYADGDTTTNIDANKTVTKSPDLWLYNDNARKLDETAYKPSGKMRGVTITLRPNGKSEYILKNGIVNQIGDESTKKGDEAGKLLSETQFFNMYNRLRSTIGDTVKVSSQTYRNSDYTIFISMGTTGGNQSDKQDAIKVYGQYNGTNLATVAAPVAGGSQDGSVSGGDSGNQGGSGGQQDNPTFTIVDKTYKDSQVDEYFDGFKIRFEETGVTPALKAVFKITPEELNSAKKIGYVCALESYALKAADWYKVNTDGTLIDTKSVTGEAKFGTVHDDGFCYGTMSLSGLTSEKRKNTRFSFSMYIIKQDNTIEYHAPYTESYSTVYNAFVSNGISTN